MLIKKEFKGQVHYFDLPDDLAEKLLLKDKRYSFADEEKKEPKKARNGNYSK